MRIRDGPAAVRGDAPPPPRHWREPGRRRGREPRVRRPVALLISGTPRGREDSGASLTRPTRRNGSRRARRLRRRRVRRFHRNGRVPGHRDRLERQGHCLQASCCASSRCRPRRPRRCSRSAPASQVVAVDDQSDFPKAAPQTSLSGFTPNVEAIAGYRPDLVVIAYDPKGLSGALGRLGITVLHQDGAKSFKGAYQQIRQLGLVTGREARAGTLIASMKKKIGTIVADARREGRASPSTTSSIPPSTRRRRRPSSGRCTPRSGCATSPTRRTRWGSATRSSRPSTSYRRAPI